MFPQLKIIKLMRVYTVHCTVNVDDVQNNVCMLYYCLIAVQYSRQYCTNGNYLNLRFQRKKWKTMLRHRSVSALSSFLRQSQVTDCLIVALLVIWEEFKQVWTCDATESLTLPQMTNDYIVKKRLATLTRRHFFSLLAFYI